MDLRHLFPQICQAALALLCACWLPPLGLAKANDVAVFLDRGELYVVGDNQANDVVIRQNPAGDLIIGGLNDTLVNGEVNYRFQGSFVELNINMGGGNDSVRFGSLMLESDLYVFLGSGRNRLVSLSQPVIVLGDVDIVGGRGRDFARIRDWSVAGDLDIQFGAGSSFLAMEAISVGLDLDITGGNAFDRIEISDFLVGQSLDIAGLGGRDIISIVDGDAQEIYVLGGAGRNDIAVDNVVADFDIDISTLNGPDAVLINNTTAQDIDIELGDGNDLLIGGQVSASRDLYINGQGGAQDEISSVAFSAGGDLEVLGFEIRR